MVYTPAGTGAVATTVATELGRQWISPEDFGAVGNGIVDDTTALTNWLNALMTGPNPFGKMKAVPYGITAPLPQINVSGIWIVGAGSDDFHNGGSGTAQTFIKWIGTTNAGTMLTIAPTNGAAQYLVGNRVLGVSFNCNALCANGTLFQSIRGGTFEWRTQDATAVGATIGCVATLSSDPPDLQGCTFWYKGSQTIGLGQAGVSLVITGTATHNSSFNTWEWIDITHTNAVGMRIDEGDNNLYEQTRIFQGSGTATNSLLVNGSNISAGAATTVERFKKFSATKAASITGTGFSFPPTNILFEVIDKGNNTPDPVFTGGATGGWRNDSTLIYPEFFVAFTPTINGGTSFVGSATGFLQADRQGGLRHPEHRGDHGRDRANVPRDHESADRLDRIRSYGNSRIRDRERDRGNRKDSGRRNHHEHPNSGGPSLSFRQRRQYHDSRHVCNCLEIASGYRWRLFQRDGLIYKQCIHCGKIIGTQDE